MAPEKYILCIVGNEAKIYICSIYNSDNKMRTQSHWYWGKKQQ